MSEPIETFPLETLERAESLQLEADSEPDGWNNLEQFQQHERQEIDTLNCLAVPLEAHRKVMDELAGAMRHLRENLFLQEDQWVS